MTALLLLCDTSSESRVGSTQKHGGRAAELHECFYFYWFLSSLKTLSCRIPFKICSSSKENTEHVRRRFGGRAAALLAPRSPFLLCPHGKKYTKSVDLILVIQWRGVSGLVAVMTPAGGEVGYWGKVVRSGWGRGIRRAVGGCVHVRWAASHGKGGIFSSVGTGENILKPRFRGISWCHPGAVLGRGLNNATPGVRR